MFWRTVLGVVVVVLACAAGVQAVDIQTVPVGDEGNTDDTHGDGYGGVDYEYRIGKYEVTNAQYAEFLRAVAATDTNGLYNSSMGSGYGGITQSGPDGSYTYDAIDTREDMPVNYVSWYDALRFANWMHNGQPAGAQDDATTEDGAYDMDLGAGVVRKPGALVFLPSEDEWYKAAYYKGGGVDAGYWDYPTETDDPNPPTAETPPGTDMVNGSANYDGVVGDLADVGAYWAKPSDSPYGTFDQGGNVWEWIEAVRDGSFRGLRGASFYDNVEFLHASSGYGGADPTYEYYSFGFRVAEVPHAHTEMEWVTVCDPGNDVDDEIMNDGTSGYGRVDYIYRIGKYEVTNAQYCEFLNAVAADDPNGLYNTDMGSGEYDIGGITRSGSAGSYTYSVRPNRANRPVSYVNWYDALRFANWMHNGQPTGPQDASTTEDGAYDMSLGSSVARKRGARVFLPSEDEWYKAAYYKGGGTSAGYWDYPTQSDAPPTAEEPPGTDLLNGSANCDGVAFDGTDVGAYTAKPSDSTYGTFDQGGNVGEWTEADIFGDGSERGFSGGWLFDLNCDSLHAASRSFNPPATEYFIVGFRVAASCEFTDADGDGDIDLADFKVFQSCFCGPSE